MKKLLALDRVMRLHQRRGRQLVYRALLDTGYLPSDFSEDTRVLGAVKVLLVTYFIQFQVQALQFPGVPAELLAFPGNPLQVSDGPFP